MKSAPLSGLEPEMMTIPSGIAHVSFSGGGIFLPARTPYDRQMLVEHVVDRAHSRGQVQVLLGEQRWMVHAKRGALALCCSSCSNTVDAACYSSPQSSGALCVRCAFAEMTAGAILPGETAQRQVG